MLLSDAVLRVYVRQRSAESGVRRLSEVAVGCGSIWLSVLLALGCAGCSTSSDGQPMKGGDDATELPSGTSPGGETKPVSITGAPSHTASAMDSSIQLTAGDEVTSEGKTSSDGRDVVRGSVIDFWGNRLAGVAVGIGDERTQTNERGEFVFTNVAATYDVSLVVRFGGDAVEVYGWRYEGLTRRDPTLQVYKGLPQREARLTFDVTGLQAPSVYAEVAVGGTHGHRAYALSSARESLAGWRGATSIQAPVHVLSWQAPQGPRVPLVYLAHATATVPLNDGEPSLLRLDVSSNGNLPLAAISGSVLPMRQEDRVQLVFARFEDGPSVLLVSEQEQADADRAFVYSTPVLDGMSLTVAVREEARVAPGEYSVAYRSDVAPGGEVGVIALALPPQLTEPLEGTSEVTKQTVFRWETDAAVSVVSFDDQQIFQGVYVVTRNRHCTLPDLSNLGLFHTNRGRYKWTVETHGVAVSSDESTGEHGFLDPFSGDLSYPMGPRQGQGRFTRSSTRAFTAAELTESPFAR